MKQEKTKTPILNQESATEERTTDMHALLYAADIAGLEQAIAQACSSRNIPVNSVTIKEMAFTCEPDNMLVNQYEAMHGNVPPTLRLYRIVVVTTKAEGQQMNTDLIAEVLPPETPWYGTTVAGRLGADALAQCAWNPPQQ